MIRAFLAHMLRSAADWLLPSEPSSLSLDEDATSFVFRTEHPAVFRAGEKEIHLFTGDVLHLHFGVEPAESAQVLH